jgi:hypothetical protein
MRSCTPPARRPRLDARGLDPGGLGDGLAIAGAAGHAGRAFVPTAVRLTRSEIGNLVAAREATLTDFQGPDDLANGEAWI